MAIGATTTDYITLKGRSYEVTVSHISKAVWRVVGKFGGKQLVGTGSSSLAAKEDWCRRALNEGFSG